MIDKAAIKNMVHDAMVLDYIMDQCGFYCMRVYEAPHKFNVFKVKLYKTDFTPTGRALNFKGCLMVYGNDNKPHVFMSSNSAFRPLVDYKIAFSDSYTFEHVQAKSMLLGIIKQSNGFKFQNEEHMRNGKLDEILVNADIDTAYSKQYEDRAVNAIELQLLIQHAPF